jgi:hypothetical protein
VTDQALKWWHVRWRPAARILSKFAVVSGKILGVLCVLAVIACGVLYVLSPWLASSRLGNFDPRLRLIPAEPPSKSQATLSNTTIDRYGFEFQIPKDATLSSTSFKYMTILQFPSGAMRINNPSRDQREWTPILVVRDDKQAQKLLGNELLHSNFNLIQAAMLTTPDQVKWWRFRSSQNERADSLLLAKFLIVENSFPIQALTSSSIYSISAGEMRGFQFGDPTTPPYEVHLDLFDKSDRHLALDIVAAREHAQVLTQEEINAIVASIHPKL